jgi:hypothetical protein
MCRTGGTSSRRPLVLAGGKDGQLGGAIVVDSVEGVAGERRQSFVDRLRVEELHGLGHRELEKCSGAHRLFPAVRKKVEGKKKKKTEGCDRRKKEREKEKGGVRKYSCLMNKEGIIIVKFEKILFTLLSFLLK